MIVNKQAGSSADFASLIHELGEAISSFGTQLAVIGAKYNTVLSTPTTLPEAPRVESKQSHKKLNKRVRDGNAPKRPLGPFLLFCQEARGVVQAEFPNMPQQEVARKLGERWETLESKSTYLERAKEERRVYAQVLAQYEATKDGVKAVEDQVNKKAKKIIPSNDVISPVKEKVINAVKENEQPTNKIPMATFDQTSQSTIGVVDEERTKTKEERRKEKKERKEQKKLKDATTTTDTESHK